MTEWYLMRARGIWRRKGNIEYMLVAHIAGKPLFGNSKEIPVTATLTYATRIEGHYVLSQMDNIDVPLESVFGVEHEESNANRKLYSKAKQLARKYCRKHGDALIDKVMQ